MNGTKLIIPQNGDMINGITFLKEVDRKNDNLRWANFICHCGIEFNAHIYAIVKHKTKSCGCLILDKQRKLNLDQVILIRKLVWDEQKTLKSVAEQFNISIRAVFNIKIGKSYKAFV